MDVININGKNRTVETIKKIVHLVPDKDGNMVDTYYIEVLISGVNRTWTEWWPQKDFQKHNPPVVM